MKQNYLYFLLIVGLLLCATPTSAQTSQQDPPTEIAIEELSIYPNPATGQKVYISTKKNEAKRIEIYNVLGKNVLATNLTGRELNISDLESGIYILKIQEGRGTATRKLVIR